MPPTLALVICLGFVIWLLRSEARAKSSGYWLAFLWLVIGSSRPISSWLNVRSGYANSTEAYLEGNLVDSVILLLLIAGGLVLLQRRKFQWGNAIRANAAIFLVYGYFLASTLWADVPFVAFKRWVREFGNVVMVLVVLSERDPLHAMTALYRRCAYILFPFSILVMIYYPVLGRYYSAMGQPLYCGVAHSKNSLGEIIFVFGLVLLWEWMEVLKPKFSQFFKTPFLARGLALLMGAYLLVQARSATAVLCAVVGAAVLATSWFTVFRRKRKRLIKIVLVATVLLFVLDSSFGLLEKVVGLLGRDMTFTGRTEIWQVVREQQTNPLFGVGFSSFWSSRSAQQIWDEFITLVSAHNGYLDVYLDGGFIGLALVLVMLVVVFRKVMGQLGSDSKMASLQFAFLLLIVVRNWSETSFLRGGPLWFTFLLLAMLPARHAVSERPAKSPQPKRSGSEATVGLKEANANA